jgi:zinc and cadmium transporter
MTPLSLTLWTVLEIALATWAAGVGSVWLAAVLMRWTEQATDQRDARSQSLLSLSAGALLATAFMHLLPEAFEAGPSPSVLFACLLGGLLFFFLLDKAELWHHGHEHGGQQAHDHPTAPQITGGWAVLTGDSLHSFGDGVLIASAFLANGRLGWLAALAVMAHEVPHHMGDLVVLRQSSDSRQWALIKVSLAGAVTVLGGCLGYFLVGYFEGALPYFLTIAASSFVYVALADLVPQLQKPLSAKETLIQVAWLLAGLVLVTLFSML